MWTRMSKKNLAEWRNYFELKHFDLTELGYFVRGYAPGTLGYVAGVSELEKRVAVLKQANLAAEDALRAKETADVLAKAATD